MDQTVGLAESSGFSIFPFVSPVAAGSPTGGFARVDHCADGEKPSTLAATGDEAFAALFVAGFRGEFASQ